MDHLSESACREGWLYELDARNASCGVWVASERGFVYCRTKWGSEFLDLELHWDADDRHGTAKPLAERGEYGPVGDWKVPGAERDRLFAFLKASSDVEEQTLWRVQYHKCGEVVSVEVAGRDEAEMLRDALVREGVEVNLERMPCDDQADVGNNGRFGG